MLTTLRTTLALIALASVTSSAHAQSIRYRFEPLSRPREFIGKAMNALRTVAGHTFDGFDYRGGTLADGTVTPLEGAPGMWTWLVGIDDAGTAFGHWQPAGSPPEEVRSFTAVGGGGGVIDPLPSGPSGGGWDYRIDGSGFLNSIGEVFVSTSQGYGVLVPVGVPAPGAAMCAGVAAGVLALRRNRRRTVRGAAGVAVIVGAGLASHASGQSVRFQAEPIDLPDWFYPMAMNSSGTIVGTFSQPGENRSQAAVWRDGRLTLLGSPAGQASMLTAINDAGHAVGVREAVLGDWFRRAVEWRGERLVDLPASLQYDSSAAGINRYGVIAGTSVDEYGLNAAVIWESGDPFVLGRGEFGRGLAINDLGDVAGTRMFGYEAVVWSSPRGTVTVLEIPDGGLRWEPGFINNSGQVLGRGSDRQVVVWAADGSAEVITPPGYDSVRINGLDQAGRAVGNGSDADGSRAWYFDGERSGPLDELVEGEWGRIDRVFAMDSSGRILAWTEAGQVVLTPVPTPSAAGILLAMSAVAIGRRRRWTA